MGYWASPPLNVLAWDSFRRCCETWVTSSREATDDPEQHFAAPAGKSSRASVVGAGAGTSTYGCADHGGRKPLRVCVWVARCCVHGGHFRYGPSAGPYDGYQRLDAAVIASATRSHD